MHSTASSFVPAAIAAATFFIVGGVAAQGITHPRIEQGRYLVRAGDCSGCHTADEGRPFAGGKAVPTPFGTIYSANITPDKDTGIGNWDDEAFYRAMHTGIDDEGKPLYPAMPYPWYTKLSRDDVTAIWAYLKTLKPVKNTVPEPKLPWPLSVRNSVRAWNALFLHEGQYRTVPDKSAQWNRGAYLVQGAGHCGACHTPKNLLGATKKDDMLQGGDAGEHWYAPDLTNELRTGLGSWSTEEIVEYLKTGSNAETAAAGSMKEVIARSTQHLTTDDLTAIAVYLKDMPGDGSASQSSQASASDTSKEVQSRGEALYADNCVACHMSNGEGLAKVFPALKGSSAVQADKADTVIHVVVSGQAMVATKAKPTGLAMPSFAGKMTDQEIADVVSYIRGAWGNSASSVSADSVAAVREHVQPLEEGPLNRPRAVEAPPLR